VISLQVSPVLSRGSFAIAVFANWTSLGFASAADRVVSSDVIMYS
jgi:hypothetical protein